MKIVIPFTLHPERHRTVLPDNARRAPQSEMEMRRAYAGAQVRVGKMAREHGKQTLVEWLQDGLPAE